jgi:hypothetical protein
MRRSAVVLALALVVAAPAPLAAQASLGHSVDLALSYRKGSHTMSASWHAQVGFANRRVWLGAGLRSSAMLTYTRDFELSDGGGLPTQQISDPRVQTLNLMVTGDVMLARRFGVGMNLDLIGASHGGTRVEGLQHFRPDRLNLFKGGSSDEGSLNSEYYVRYAVDARTAVRVGVSHYVIGYEDRNSNARYNRFETAAFAGIRVGF